METAPELPRMLGPYRTVRMLGAGGEGRVYLAERVEFAQRVAVKCFDAVTLPGDPDARGRAGEGEEQALTLLDHPNIVRWIGQGALEDGGRYLAMEYIDGQAITEYADKRRLTVEARVRLLLPVLDAVAYAHGQLLVHCDLKPGNVLVSADGQPKLLDFGAAARAGGSGAGLTRLYASPEQQTGGVVTVASDVYALGLLLREVLAGLGPEEPRDAPVVPVFYITRQRRMPIGYLQARDRAELRSTTPEGLDSRLRGDLQAIIRKATEEKPEDRYGSVEAMRRDLERHLGSLPISARATGRGERAWLWAWRHGVAAAMLVLLTVVVAGSAWGVAWKAAVAAHQRRLAEQRLDVLVRMNGSLEGELYGSVAHLAGSEKARQSLLDGATATLDSVSAEGTRDPKLALALAEQFEGVARLEAGAGQAEAARASVNKGLAVLGEVSSSGVMEAERRRLRGLAP